MPRVERWRVYYDDGTSFSSGDGPPEDAPLDGVQAVAEWVDNGTTRLHEGFDYYWWTGDCWACGRINDLERWLRSFAPRLKFGRWTMDAVHRRVMEDLRGGR